MTPKHIWLWIAGAAVIVGVSLGGWWWMRADQTVIGDIIPDTTAQMAFEGGSMVPKVDSGCAFVRAGGLIAGIGRLADARQILQGQRGSRITVLHLANMKRIVAGAI